MPSQIEIANSLRRTDIFQLDARKGHAPPPEDEGRGETVGVAVVAVEVRPALTVNNLYIINSEGWELNWWRGGVKARTLETNRQRRWAVWRRRRKCLSWFSDALMSHGMRKEERVYHENQGK